MPELPEVETIKLELEQKISGQKISGMIVNNAKVIKEPAEKEFKKGILGASITKILRRAKVLILELSNGKSLVIHLRMTGQLVYPGDGKRSRVSFRLGNGKLLDFNDQRLFGELRLVDSWQDIKFIKELGPEPFGITFKQLKEMLKSKKTKIKPLLMDQTFISGIGNLYASEILFGAKVDPLRQAQSLNDKEIKAVLKEAKAVLASAIDHGGSSVDDYVRLSGKPGGYAAYHKVYARAGKPCPVCKGLIKRIALGGRGTFYCPKCQK